MDAVFAELSTPGSTACALVIYRDGRIPFVKDYGLANLETAVRITP